MSLQPAIDRSHRYVAAFFALALVLAIAGTAHPALYGVSYNGRTVMEIGIFSTEYINQYNPNNPNANVQEVTRCNHVKTYGSDNVCMQALDDKCRAMQAFSVIGLIANTILVLITVARIFVPTFDGRWNKIGSLTSVVTAFSYMLVMSIAASLHNGKYDVLSSECSILAGVQNGDNDDMAYGASFGLFVFAWIFVTGATIFKSRLDCIAHVYAPQYPAMGAGGYTPI